MLKIVISFSLLLLIGCGKEDATSKRFVFEEPGDLPPISARLRNTHYYTIFESDFNSSEKRSVKIYDRFGNVLTRVTASFNTNLVMEGSGKLNDGRVINYDTSIGGIHRFRVVKNEWGVGVGGCILKPFRTVAVDRKIIPLGSKVYIDQTRGMPLPDGTLHDGYWRADDVGSAINRDRVDLFIGKKLWSNFLARYKVGHLQALDVRIIEYPNESSCPYR